MRFDYWWTFAIVGLGGLLGVLFSVPLRRTLIIEQKLKFPEGVAAAEVLKVGANPGVGAKVLGLASVVGGLFKLITSGFGLLPESFVLQPVALSAVRTGQEQPTFVRFNIAHTEPRFLDDSKRSR